MTASQPAVHRLAGRIGVDAHQTGLSVMSRLANLSYSNTDPHQDMAFRFDAEPASSISAEISTAEFARQCSHAAHSSRLDPAVLDPEEFVMLKAAVTVKQVTIYLNIRNAILRLWARNPLVSVTINEAIGCARTHRYMPLAIAAYNWLVRRGYINFGCVSVPDPEVPLATLSVQVRRPRVVVIGAGMAGLGFARQMDGLGRHFQQELFSNGFGLPEIVVLESRNRVGGRIYSAPTSSGSESANGSIVRPGVVELGAQIVTGFECGNPLNALIRGQLGLPVHMIRGARDVTLYDIDGDPERDSDKRVDDLFNDILDRAAQFKAVPKLPVTVAGDPGMIRDGINPTDSEEELDINDIETLAELEKTGLLETVSGVAKQNGPEKLDSAANAALKMGWTLKSRVALKHSIQLDGPAGKENSDLGSVIELALSQYQRLIKMSSRDMRMLNWHCANLEYSAAARLNQLSLAGWDQDSGNEFEGVHSNVVGGLVQVPWALSRAPDRLDVRLGHTVSMIRRQGPGSRAVAIGCTNGTTIEADMVLVSVPLGVLKQGRITFEPELPTEKQACIDRLGFGLMNKIVLVFATRFWTMHNDGFGLLQAPAGHPVTSLEPVHYATHRGAFHIFWDCSVAASEPCLVAMMAGAAAEKTEQTDDAALISLALTDLGRVFGPSNVPRPVQSFVTRWGQDPNSAGSYSYISVSSKPDDHDQLASPVDPIFFAGEATCSSHPATIHGAYLSGLRAASEMLDRMIGPIPSFGPALINGPGSHQTNRRSYHRPHPISFHTVRRAGPAPQSVSAPSKRSFPTQQDSRPGSRSGSGSRQRKTRRSLSGDSVPISSAASTPVFSDGFGSLAPTPSSQTMGGSR